MQPERRDRGHDRAESSRKKRLAPLWLRRMVFGRRHFWPAGPFVPPNSSREKKKRLKYSFAVSGTACCPVAATAKLKCSIRSWPTAGSDRRALHLAPCVGVGPAETDFSVLFTIRSGQARRERRTALPAALILRLFPC